jgi:hypothetical protein
MFNCVRLGLRDPDCCPRGPETENKTSTTMTLSQGSLPEPPREKRITLLTDAIALPKTDRRGDKNLSCSRKNANKKSSEKIPDKTE